MIHDTFMFYNEEDILDIRLHTLDPVVDKFYLCEATYSYDGKPKKLYYRDKLRHRKPFNKFKNKIEYILCDNPPHPHTERIKTVSQPNRMKNANHQRRCLTEGLIKKGNPKQNDIIINSDLDEIPNPEIIKKIGNQRGPFKFPTLHCHFFFNNIVYTYRTWYGSIACRYSDFVDILTLRRWSKRLLHDLTSHHVTSNDEEYYMGWHFSYLGDIEFIMNKIKTFTPGARFDHPKLNNPNHIKNCIRTGKDLYSRSGWELQREKLYLPKYVENNIDKFWSHVCIGENLGNEKNDYPSENARWLANISSQCKYIGYIGNPGKFRNCMFDECKNILNAEETNREYDMLFVNTKYDKKYEKLVRLGGIICVHSNHKIDGFIEGEKTNNLWYQYQ